MADNSNIFLRNCSWQCCYLICFAVLVWKSVSFNWGEMVWCQCNHNQMFMLVTTTHTEIFPVLALTHNLQYDGI